jgi:hypothetical protein
MYMISYFFITVTSFWSKRPTFGQEAIIHYSQVKILA